MPRLRIASCPISGSAAASSGTLSATASDSSATYSRVIAPTATWPSVTDTPDSSTQAVDVDEHRGSRQAQRQQRDQALPAGEDARLVLVLGEQADGFRERRGCLVRKVRQLHRRTAPSRGPQSSLETDSKSATLTPPGLGNLARQH